MTGALETELGELIRAIIRAELDRAVADIVERINASPPPRYLTVGEAAKLAALGQRTIEAAIANGDLAVVRRGRSVRVPVDELDGWLLGRHTA